MKTQKVIITIILPLSLLFSCEKDHDIPEGITDLSTDSLRIVQSNIPVGLYTDLVFAGATTGYAITNFGDIIKTTDGGFTWEQLLSPVNFFLSKIQFTDGQTGYVIGGDDTGGYLLKTVNAGQTWQVIDLQTPDNIIPTGMFFLNNAIGFVAGEKFFRRTVDGGQTWSEVINPASVNINDVCFKNGNEGYATSDGGKYYKTTDGGDNWQEKQSNLSDKLKKIYFGEAKSFAKCLSSKLVDLDTGDEAFSVPANAHNFLFLDDNRCVGIGQHYEEGFLPYGDILLTNDAWSTYNQKKYNPQSEAMNVSAITKAEDGKVIIIGSGAINSSVIVLNY